MPKIAAAVQRKINEACKEAGSGRPPECVEAVAGKIREQAARACRYRAAERQTPVASCTDRLVSSYWLNIDQLKKRLPAKLKYVADDILESSPLEAGDGTTHRSLATFVDKEARIFAREEAVPPEARCMSHYERKIFERLNQDRGRFGQKPLKPDCDLVKAAKSHSEDLGRHKPDWINNDTYKPHIGSDGRTPHERITAATAGRFYKTAENTWRSGMMYTLFNSDACQVDLMNSEGHRNNILAPDLTHAGIGIYVDPNNGQVFVTQNFGGVPQGAGASHRAGGR
ncbi:MAG: CAP domain-containing protein [Deltaproteobacteria bacterium]|nr:CAP domain-containing protein [Deltaproteobacteria bacterium]